MDWRIFPTPRRPSSCTTQKVLLYHFDTAETPPVEVVRLCVSGGSSVVSVPNGRLVEVDDTATWLPLDRSEVVADLIDQFVCPSWAA
jgi:hypothetical protein